jgi:hypothetical protein
MNFHSLDLLPNVLLAARLHPVTLISILDLAPRHLFLVNISAKISCYPRNQASSNITHLLVLRKTHHQLRLSQRQRITSIDLPEMKSLPVQANDFLHFLRLGSLPNSVGNIRVRHYEDAAADLFLINRHFSTMSGLYESDGLSKWEKRLPRFLTSKS